MIQKNAGFIKKRLLDDFSGPLSPGMLLCSQYLWNGSVISRYKEMLKNQHEGAPLSSLIVAEVVCVSIL